MCVRLTTVFAIISIVVIMPSQLYAQIAKADQDAQEAARAATFRQHIERASGCYKRGDYQCAYDGYKQAYAVNSQPLLLFNMAQVCRKNGRTQDALDLFERFLTEAPKSELVPEIRSYVSALKSSKAKSASIIRTPSAPSINATNHFVGTEQERLAKYKEHLQSALTKVATGDCDGAVTSYWAAYTLKPKTSIIFNVARVYRNAGRFAEALALYQRYLQEEPDTSVGPEVEGYIAEVQQRLREQQRAAEERLAKANAVLAERMAEVERHRALLRSPQRPQPVYRRAWFWGLVGTAAAGVALGVGLGVGLQSKIPEADLGARTLNF